jgi:dihydroxyacetone kinase, L subunit
MLMSNLPVETTLAWLADYAKVVTDNSAMLTDLDRQIGDADHGSNMTRGMSAVAALDPQSFADTGALLKKAGMTLVSTVGGASGPLYGTLFLRLGAFLGPDKELSVQNLAQAFKAGLDGIMTRGKAEPGDKTMVDALAPAVEALQTDAEAGRTLQEALDHAAQAAAQGRDATVGMIARRGRASYLGERSKGHQDPGATSLTLFIESAARCLPAQS